MILIKIAFLAENLGVIVSLSDSYSATMPLSKPISDIFNADGETFKKGKH